MSAGKTSLVATLVGGRYLVDQEIGAGGISTVYLARDFQAFGRNVVVKVLQDAFQHDDYIIKKFRQEAEALSRVDHPNVVSIHGRGELEDGRPYIVLQYIKGQSLRDIMVPGGIDLERAATIIRWVAHALTATHEAGVLHRDLKPENVMLQTFGDEERVVVIDFGIAQVKDSVIGHKTSLATAVGTVSYMSPEQLSGEELTPASDTFALGVIAYELITGEKPFKPSTAYQLLDEQRAGVEVPPKQLRPELHGPAQEAILRALSFDPALRQARTRDFGNEVYRSVTGATAPLSGPLPEPFTRHAPRTRLMETDGLPAVEEYAPEPPAEEYEAAPADEARREDSAYVTPTPPRVVPPPTPTPRPHKLLLVAVGLLLLFSLVAVTVVGFFVWKKMREQTAIVEPSPAATTTPRATPTPAATPTPPPPAAPRLSLEYSLTIQMMRDGKPYKEPLESTGRERYESGTRAWMNLSIPSPGYLYLLNEGPDERGNILYSLLYPADGDARVAATQRLQIPGDREHFFEFKHGAGTEKVWVVWSEQPVPEMEGLKGLMNEENNWGDVTDPAQIQTVRDFLSKHDTSKTEAVEGKDKMTVKSSDDVLVHGFELKHYN